MLDIGCGTGSLLRSFAKRNLKVAGVDISAIALKKAKSVLEDAKADFSLIQLDLNDPYFSDKYTESFDIVVTHLVIAFIPNRDIFLKNIGNLLSKNGIYICSTPVLLKNRSYNDHQTRISLEEKDMEDLLKRNFASVSLLEADEAKRPDWPLRAYICRSPITSEHQ